MTQGSFAAYSRGLDELVRGTAVTDAAGRSVALESAVSSLGRQMHEAHERGNRIFFIGNGGSAGIASHLAVDFSKNGGMRASALNDASVITCLGNDYGYEHIFSKQLEWHARPNDIVVAISSSGRSKNILNGSSAARAKDCRLVTFSGFDANNPLRGLGDLNFFVASHLYGFVEIAHLALLHGVLDIQMGWQPAIEYSAA